ncbi:hypothetical protein DBR42_09325, partial [Pelomonas sp. HMWF004]
MRRSFAQVMKLLGWPGLAGLVALLLAAAALLLGQRWDAQAAALQAEARQLRARTAPVAVIAVQPVSLQQWQATLPPP